MHKPNVVHINGGLAVVLPVEVIDRMCLAEGDVVYFAAVGDGYQLTLTDPVAEQLKIGRKLMKKYRKAFATLAKP